MAAEIFSDNFEDGDSAGWTVIGNPGWHVENGRYGILLNPGLSNTLPSDWDTSKTSISYDLDLAGTQGEDRNILVKFKDQSNFLEVHANSLGIYLDKASSIGGGGVQAYSPITLSNNVSYHFRIEILNNTNIRVYLNGSLIMAVDESSPVITNWKPGLRAGTGGTPITEVWFDNLVISDLEISTPTPSPTPAPTPYPSPSISPEPAPTIGPFELPISYPGRLQNIPSQFRYSFWAGVTATFDHALQSLSHIPFSGEVFFPATILNCDTGIGCYDSHNGVDFWAIENQEVYSVAPGYVVFTSIHNETSCSPESTYGCVVIAKHPGNHYAVYAHLNRINVSPGNFLDQQTLIGEMGATGCVGCGIHLHFGLLKPFKGPKNTLLVNLMGRKHWNNFLNNVAPQLGKAPQPYCSYKSPNGAQFYFQDPTGWKGEGKDPWSLPIKKGGCGVNSPYLWKYDVGENSLSY